jgi:hypothetical protein
MPFRHHVGVAKLQFACAAEVPSLISQARAKRGYPSNTVYVQRVLARALAEDLGIDYDELISHMPPTRTNYDRFNPPSVPAENVK